MPDALRLAVGTLTRIPVPPPRRVDGSVARRAMLLAPLVGAVLGLVLGGLGQLAAAHLSPAAGPLVVSAVTFAALAYLTRAIHLDGLADTADALGSGRPAEQALAIARRSDIGPFGVVTIVLTLLVQISAYAGLVSAGTAMVGLGIALGSGRLAITLACVRGVPAARADGLGAVVAGCVPPWAVAMATVGWAAACLVLAVLTDTSPVGAAAAVVAALVAGAIVVLIAVRRLGGITGDVLGAAAEIATAAALVILVAVPL